jgi:hypothetical protein
MNSVQVFVPKTLEVSNPEPESLAAPNVNREEDEIRTYPLLARLEALTPGELSGLAWIPMEGKPANKSA